MRALRQAGEIPDTLLLLEHPPVYTRGRRSAPSDLPRGEDFYRERGIDVVDVDRGGRVTYHAPGQLVGYPIMAVADVVAHVRAIEDAIIDALSEEGIAARARAQEGPDYTGVWVPGAQDREHRGARPARCQHPRLRGQRQQRARAVLLGARHAGSRT